MCIVAACTGVYPKNMALGQVVTKIAGHVDTLERLRLTTSTANVYGKATRTRTRNRRRFLVKIVRATCRPYGVI